MTGMDRREWLKTAGLAVGGLLAGAPTQAASTSPANATAAMIKARLSLNENPFGPAPGVIEALRREFGSLSRYTGQEATALVALIAAKEQVPPEQIVLGEILEPLGMHLGLQGGPGGEIIYSSPGYTALVDAAASVGGVGVPVPLNTELENHLLAISALITAQTRAVFLVNPHNPSGTVSDNSDFKEFLRNVAGRTLAIVDEAYLEFTEDFATRTAVDLVRSGANVIVFRTFAKMYGLAGLDIGYALVPAAVGTVLRDKGLGNPRLHNRLAVVAATASLRDPKFVEIVRQKVAAERGLWNQLLRDLKLRHSAARGNFVFFDTRQPHAQFSAALLAEGVEIARAFSPLDTWARISIGLPAENTLARNAVRRVLDQRAR